MPVSTGTRTFGPHRCGDGGSWPTTTHRLQILAGYRHYGNIPGGLVPFDQDIYGHLEKALKGWRSNRSDAYRSPLQVLQW
jgi:hypothetical protein